MILHSGVRKNSLRYQYHIISALEKQSVSFGLLAKTQEKFKNPEKTGERSGAPA
jgi:hypothetical protein